MNSDVLATTRLYAHSHWLRILYDGLGRWLSVPGACLLWVIVQAALFIGLAHREGTLWGSGQPLELPLAYDTTFLAYFFLLPFCFGLLYASLKLFGHYLTRLEEVLVPESLPRAREQLQDVAAGSFERGTFWVRIGFTLLGLAIATYNAFISRDPERFYGTAWKWDSLSHPMSYWAARVYVFLVWGYWLPIWATAVFAQLRAMVRITRTMSENDWLRLTPYALDGFGGLGRLATAASWAGYLIIAGSLFFLAPLVRHAVFELPLHVGNYVGLAAYITLAAIGVFSPVFILHRGLTHKRTQILSFLNEAFIEINARVSHLVREKNIEALSDENLGRALETIDRLHQQWKSLPAWPMSLAVILRFVATVVIPAVGYVLVQQWFKDMVRT